MGIHYTCRQDADLYRQSLLAKMKQAKKTLKRLKALEESLSGSTSGDGEFDVELIVAINVAKGAVLRLKAVLNEQAKSTDRRQPQRQKVTC